MKLENFLIPYTKISLKWIKHFNIRPETTKFLQENIGKTLFDINCSNNFLIWLLRQRKKKAKIKKWDLMKLKSFCTTKEAIDKTKIQLTEWEKIFANDMTDKGLIFNIYKGLVELDIKKTTQSKKEQKT